MPTTFTAAFKDRVVEGGGRGGHEAAIRDHLDLGRPERVSLVVDRRVNRRTPGRFATKVISRGVDPQIQIHYRASKVRPTSKSPAPCAWRLR